MAVSLVPNLTNNYLLLLLNLWVIWPIQALSEFTHLSVSTLLAKDQLKTYYDEKMGFFLNVCMSVPYIKWNVEFLFSIFGLYSSKNGRSRLPH